MPNRHGQNENYRYGWNGAEKDDEIRGSTGSNYDLGARMYDPRIGRMLSVDPWTNKYAWQSPYVYHKNSPISSIDWKGLGDPKDRKANKGISESEKSNKAKAGTSHKAGIYADVSMTNGNTNNPDKAFPDKIAEANNLTTKQLYALNPGLEANRHSIGQGQFIRTVPEKGKEINDYVYKAVSHNALVDNTRTAQKGIIKEGLPHLFHNELERKNHYSIEANDEYATEGPGSGIEYDWGLGDVLKMFEPFAGNTNPVVSNNIKRWGGYGDAPAASKPVIYSPGYPQVYKTSTQSVRNYSGYWVTTHYSNDSSVKIGTFTNHNTGEIRRDTTIKGSSTDTVLSPVMFNF